MSVVYSEYKYNLNDQISTITASYRVRPIRIIAVMITKGLVLRSVS